jgi:hypothetical protein
MPNVPVNVPDIGEAEIDALRRAQNGDESAVPTVKRLMERFPRLAVEAGDMGRIAELTLVDQIAGDNRLFAEGIRACIANLRSEVAGPTPTPLEELLASSVALSWLEACNVSTRFAQVFKEGASWERVREYSRWQDRTHRRFLAACRTLAQVRRLLRPTVAQVNIAEKQINIAAAAVGDGAAAALPDDALPGAANEWEGQGRCTS